MSSARTRIEREFDPDAIRQLKAVLGPRHHGRRRPARRRRRCAAGLVDECHLFLGPIVVGGGKRALPDDVRVTARAARRAPLRQRCRSPPLPGEIGGVELKLAEQVSGAGWSAAVDGEGLVHGAVGVAAHRPDVASRAGADRVEARVDR